MPRHNFLRNCLNMCLSHFLDTKCILYTHIIPIYMYICSRFITLDVYVYFTALYSLSIGVFMAPGDFPSYIEMIKSWNMSPAIMFPLKTVVAFPLVYHYINGIRHLVSHNPSCQNNPTHKNGGILVLKILVL